MKTMAWVLCTLLAGPATAQVFKCKVDGTTVYQARPCATTDGTGEEVRLHVAPAAPSHSHSPKVQSGPAQPQAAPSTPAAPAIPQKPWMEVEADACLAWYRPRLRDPRSAYYRDLAKDGQVLTMTIYATNGSGGYATKAAACEMKGGDVDDGWTKLHAERLGWMEACAQPVMPWGPGLPRPPTAHQDGHGRQARGIQTCAP